MVACCSVWIKGRHTENFRERLKTSKRLYRWGGHEAEGITWRSQMLTLDSKQMFTENLVNLNNSKRNDQK